MKSLFLFLLLAAASAVAAPGDVQLYTAGATGSLTVGPDGRVVEVELESSDSLGDGVLEGFEAQIRNWRFEPVTEGGQPVVANGRMSLSLVAARKQGSDQIRFGIRHVKFMDPPGKPSPFSESRLAQPDYPVNALREGTGAFVLLLVKLDAEGRPALVTTERLELLGMSTRQSHQSHIAKQFRRSAERVAVKWTFSGRQDGEVVRVPVRYTPMGMSGRWVPTVIQPVELPEWAVQETALRPASELGDNGAAIAAQFKLLTPLDNS